VAVLFIVRTGTSPVPTYYIPANWVFQKSLDALDMNHRFAEDQKNNIWFKEIVDTDREGEEGEKR